MHAEVHAYVERQVRRFQWFPKKVLDLGGRDVNGSHRYLFHARTEYVVVDHEPGPGVDIVSEIHDFSTDDRFDIVLCTEVLEHTDGGDVIVGLAHQHLVPGGMAIFTTAWRQRAPHGATGGALAKGEHYANIDARDLVEWLEPFARWQVETDDRSWDIRAVAWKGEVTSAY